MYKEPADVEATLSFVEKLLRHPGVTRLGSGPRHWDIFSELCRAVDARGNLVSDAAIAAVAIEHGATLVSLDRDFAKFPGLRWELPGNG
ncbi:PIN domain-containing protein [Microbacterium sp. NIBRBAC000506063]|uniref:PIN domain-containing protein n=1 Tax=Microbacterium sp. NIBRBAC000506063 TaxID=2734618 RepID=UPI001BB533DA|nr:PIN domain-containing protein [Microbacterium sp. NIBRBAC000506063]QTV79309.1 PIN domain-containing protein [Microbacterium sp. NIBRBAC000506063]